MATFFLYEKFYCTPWLNQNVPFSLTLTNIHKNLELQRLLNRLKLFSIHNSHHVTLFVIKRVVSREKRYVSWELTQSKKTLKKSRRHLWTKTLPNSWLSLDTRSKYSGRRLFSAKQNKAKERKRFCPFLLITTWPHRMFKKSLKSHPIVSYRKGHCPRLTSSNKTTAIKLKTFFHFVGNLHSITFNKSLL